MNKNYKVNNTQGAKKGQRKKPTRVPPPPGIEKVCGTLKGEILWCKENGDRYKVKVRYRSGNIQFKTYVVAHDGEYRKISRLKDRPAMLSKNRAARRHHLFTDD